MQTWRTVSNGRVLDFDIENRPLNYAGVDFTFSEITAIAWKFIGERGVIECGLLTKDGPGSMLPDFLEAFGAADMVTGHNIIKHDLRLINGMALESGQAPLRRMLVQDTYGHLKKRGGISASQENLAAVLGIPEPKIAMNGAKWRTANRLSDEGIELTLKRAVGDVRQHVSLRKRLLELGWLAPPRWWSP